MSILHKKRDKTDIKYNRSQRFHNCIKIWLILFHFRFEFKYDGFWSGLVLTIFIVESKTRFGLDLNGNFGFGSNTTYSRRALKELCSNSCSLESTEFDKPMKMDPFKAVNKKYLQKYFL